jgi:hypothetical protein
MELASQGAAPRLAHLHLDATQSVIMLGYGSEDNAVSIANDTPYGLASCIEGDLEEASLLSRRLRTGPCASTVLHGCRSAC